jgi:hypothetical protein
VDADPLAQAFVSLRAPFRILDLRDARARELYGRELVLLRPDMHVAWRGDRMPADPARLARMATGHRPVRP